MAGVAIDKTLIKKYLKEHGWLCHPTTDGREYWNKNGSTLMTIGAAFENQVKAEIKDKE